MARTAKGNWDPASPFPKFNVSFGVFPAASASDVLTRDDMQKLYFSTTASQEHAGRQTQEGGEIENMSHVHLIGRRDGKYMKYQINRAPLLQRDSCRYTRDYAPKYLGDYVCNKELAETFRYSVSHQTGVELNNRSLYSEDFPPTTPQQMKAAKLPSQAPKQLRTHTLGGSGNEMHVKTSFSHNQHQRPSGDVSSCCERFIPKPNLTLAGNRLSNYKSLYREDFKGTRKDSSLSRCQSVPSVLESSVNDDLTLSTRRVCFMSPGQ